MTEQVRLDNEELQAVVAEWGAAVPPAVAHPPIPAGSDPASLLAAGLCAGWPAMDATRDAARLARADKFSTAEFVTGAELTAADTANAQQMNGLSL
jgi:hypothetical protein